MSHVHEPAHTVTTKTTRWEVCRCGATRSSALNKKPVGGWHTCKLCTAPWGLAQEKNLNEH